MSHETVINSSIDYKSYKIGVIEMTFLFTRELSLTYIKQYLEYCKEYKYQPDANIIIYASEKYRLKYNDGHYFINR